VFKGWIEIKKMNHDQELLALVKEKRLKKVFDADGNFNVKWYEERMKCYDFYNDRGKKEFRMYSYADGSFQMSYLSAREAILGSW
jgi:hypothetical protein